MPAAQSEGGDTLRCGFAVLQWAFRWVSERSWVVGPHQVGSETFVKYMELGQGDQPGHHRCFLPLHLGLQFLSRKPQNLDLFQEAAASAKGIRVELAEEGSQAPRLATSAWYLSAS